MPPGEGEPEFGEEPRTWWERLRTDIRSRDAKRTLHRRYDRVVRPETGLLEDAVIATWELRSRSRIVRPTVEMYDRVLRTHQELNGAEERLRSWPTLFAENMGRHCSDSARRRKHISRRLRGCVTPGVRSYLNRGEQRRSLGRHAK